MARSDASDYWQTAPNLLAGRRPDLRALTLALALTALLIALLASLGAVSRDTALPDDLLVVFDVPAPVAQADEPPPTDMPKPPTAGPVEQNVAARPAPSSPAAAMSAPALAVVPVPQIALSPVTVPEVVVSGDASVIAETEGTQNSGVGKFAGAGAGGDGTRGTGTGGNGAGGKGGRQRLTARWAPEMRMSQLNAFFPDTALESGQGGYALVKCFVLQDHSVRDCIAIDEHPAGLGFGAAAVRSEPVMRVQVRDAKGKRVYNTWVLYHAYFRHPVTNRRAPKR